MPNYVSLLPTLQFQQINPEDPHLVGLITEFGSKWNAALEDGTITAAERGQLLGVCIRIAQHSLEVIENPAAHIDPLVTDLEKLYDAFVRPIDLPYIPNQFGIEEMVDNQFKSTIRPIVSAIISAN